MECVHGIEIGEKCQECRANKKCYQVLNFDGKPASSDHLDLCIFESRKKAKQYIKSLVVQDTWTIIEVQVKGHKTIN